MKLLEVTGAEAFEMMADLFDPITDIASDAEILKCIQTNQKVKAIKFALKNHSKAMAQIMAICEGVPLDEYNKSLPEMMKDVLTVMNHPVVADLFTSQAQKEETSTGSAMESTEASEK